MSLAAGFGSTSGRAWCWSSTWLQNVAYSFWLKNVVIIDVMVLSLGFLLRVVAGVVVVQVTNFSPWLYICVTLLALFLGFGKRRQEIVLLEGRRRPAPRQPGGVQPAPARPDHHHHHHQHADRLHLLQLRRGHGAGAQPHADHRALCLLLHRPLSVPGARPGIWAARRTNCCWKTSRCWSTARCGR